MKPVDFEGKNITYAEDQPEYQPLPAHVSLDGTVTTRWKLSIWELIKVSFTGEIWLQVMTFTNPLQPVLISVDKPTLEANHEDR